MGQPSTCLVLGLLAVCSIGASLPTRVVAQGSASVASGDPNTPVIVFVHGRDQAVDSIAAVREVFLGSFSRGERNWLGKEIVPSSALVFVWYADAIDPNSDQMPTNGSCNYAEDPSPEAEALRTGIRDDLIALAEKLHLDGVALRILTKDTYKYLSSGGVRCEADSRLGAELSRRGFQNRPLIIVAHSMGGLVSFASIKRNAESVNAANKLDIRRLVTIGTQVGLPLVLRGLFGTYVEPPLPEPNTIHSWLNFMNQGDVLAFPTHASFVATDTSRAPKDISINTPPGERHSAAGYLADREVLRAILSSWCGAHGQEGKPAECGAVENEK